MELFGNNFKNFIEIGSFVITMYALCIVTGMIVGTIVSIKEGKKLGIDKNTILDGLLYAIPLGILGARIYYVIFEWERYYVEGEFMETVFNIFRLSEGGLAITGGIIVAVIFVIIYCPLKKVNYFKVFDLLAPGLLIGQIFGRWGNFFNQEAFGGVVKNVDILYTIFPDWIIDHMYISGQYRHPTFLYESLWNLFGLILIFVLRRKFKKIQLGDFLGFYMIWYGFGRAVLIEPYRTDALMMGDIRINILIPALMVVGGVIYLIVKHIKFPQALYVDEVNKNLALEIENIDETSELLEELTQDDIEKYKKEIENDDDNETNQEVVENLEEKSIIEKE